MAAGAGWLRVPRGSWAGWGAREGPLPCPRRGREGAVQTQSRWGFPQWPLPFQDWVRTTARLLVGVYGSLGSCLALEAEHRAGVVVWSLAAPGMPQDHQARQWSSLDIGKQALRAGVAVLLCRESEAGTVSWVAHRCGRLGAVCCPCGAPGSRRDARCALGPQVSLQLGSMGLLSEKGVMGLPYRWAEQTNKKPNKRHCTWCKNWG